MGRVEDRGRHDHCLQPRNLRIASATTALALPAPTRSEPRSPACPVPAKDRSGAKPPGASPGLQRVHPLPLLLALPAAGIGRTARASLPGRATQRADPEIRQALEQKLSDPQGWRSYGELKEWLQREFGVQAAYTTIHGWVRYKLGAKLKRGRKRSHQADLQQQRQFKKNLAASSRS